MDHVNRIKAAVTAVLGLLTALWGWFGWLVLAWAVCMGLDVLTGMGAALKTGKWSSAVARDGLWHKAGCIAAVSVAGLLDLVMSLLLDNMGQALPIRYTVLLCPLMIAWYILTEAGSIIENAGEMGAPVAGWMVKAIAALRDTVDKAAEKEEDPGSE